MLKNNKAFTERVAREKAILARNARLATKRAAKASVLYPGDEIAQQCYILGAQETSKRGRILTCLMHYECGTLYVEDIAKEVDLSDDEVVAAVSYLSPRAKESTPHFRYVFAYDRSDRSVTVSRFVAKVSLAGKHRKASQSATETGVSEPAATPVPAEAIAA
ncbi:MAG: hypothetical protein ACHQ6U_10885 [Thermodesulfobacteriota bacterium]